MGYEKELRIGMIGPSSRVMEEAEENPDFKIFCMACVRRHREHDWGDVTPEQWRENDIFAETGQELTSEYVIPDYFCIGYADRIYVTTLDDRSETWIRMPLDMEE